MEEEACKLVFNICSIGSDSNVERVRTGNLLVIPIQDSIQADSLRGAEMPQMPSVEGPLETLANKYTNNSDLWNLAIDAYAEADIKYFELVERHDDLLGAGIISEEQIGETKIFFMLDNQTLVGAIEALETAYDELEAERNDHLSDNSITEVEQEIIDGYQKVFEDKYRDFMLALKSFTDSKEAFELAVNQRPL